MSMALGAFIAGVLLAESEFRHALEAYIEPLKGLLLGLFFIAVGMSVNFGLLTTEVGMVLGLVIALVAIKALVLYVLGQISGLDYGSRQSLAISISQGGEFAFVILGIAVGAGGLARELADLVIMAVTPFLYLLLDRFSKKALEAPRPEDDMPDGLEHPVIIAGFGRFGQIIGRMLRAKQIAFTALELNPN
jgi:glutathione-regulated potassium-efflux system ancillary protein KefC